MTRALGSPVALAADRLVQGDVVLSPAGGDLSAHGDDDFDDGSVSTFGGAHSIARVSSHTQIEGWH